MDYVFTVKNDKYYVYEATGIADDLEHLLASKKEVKLESTGYKSRVDFNELDDLLFDYLDAEVIDVSDYIPRLQKAGLDTNKDNYIRIICPYLPFRHYYHKIKKWIL